jgi:hypothetical protein
MIKQTLLGVTAVTLLTPILAEAGHHKEKKSEPFHEYSSLAEALSGGEVDISLRYRYAHIDQDGVDKEAGASTLQTLLGYQTGQFEGFSAYVQARNVTVIGEERYNDTLNGETEYPVEADPHATEVDQAYIQYNGIEDTKITAGRRKLNLGNQRFVSDLGWRQNNRSFDGVVVENKSIPDTKIFYAYTNNVNRAFTDDSVNGNFDEDTEIHMLNVVNKSLPVGKIQAYGYWLDLDGTLAPVPENISTATYGVSLKGKTKLAEKVKFKYYLEYTKQTDHGDNPNNIDVDYYHIQPSIWAYGFNLTAGYEVLGSDDGAYGFSAPLGLLHAFNGWADVFLTTPANGLEDTYIKAVYKVKNTGTFLDGTKFVVAYHEFAPEESGSDYGSEVDAMVARKFGEKKNYSVALKYANYDADSFATDREKVWLTLGAKF